MRSRPTSTITTSTRPIQNSQYCGVMVEKNSCSILNTALASLDVFAFEKSADLMLVLVLGGTGYLYGGLIGAVVFKMLQEFFSTITPQYWTFWIGLVLVVIVLVGRERMHRWALWLPNLVIRQFAGRKAVVTVPESDAP